MSTKCHGLDGKFLTFDRLLRRAGSRRPCHPFGDQIEPCQTLKVPVSLLASVTDHDAVVPLIGIADDHSAPSILMLHESFTDGHSVVSYRVDLVGWRSLSPPDRA